MSDLIHADELLKRLHGIAFKDCDDREIVYSIVDELRTESITVDDSERIKILNETQHWRDQCRSYEQTIVKLSVALMERAESKNTKNSKSEGIAFGEPYSSDMYKGAYYVDPKDHKIKKIM